MANPEDVSRVVHLWVHLDRSEVPKNKDVMVDKQLIYMANCSYCSRLPEIVQWSLRAFHPALLRSSHLTTFPRSVLTQEL